MTENKTPWFRHGDCAILSLLLLWLIGAGLWFSSLYFYRVCDKAFIALRYAKNMLLGHGLVFNQGERIEGYMNFLWLLLLAPQHIIARWFGLMPSQLAVFTTICISAVIIFMLWRISLQILGKDKSIALVPAILLAFDNIFLVNTVMGLEGHLLLLLFLIAVLLLERDFKRRANQAAFGFFCSALVMTRHDSLLLPLLLFSALILGKRADLKSNRRGLITAALCAIVPLSIWTLWRWGYYGQILPNTIFSQLLSVDSRSISNGINYISRFMLDELYLPILIIPALFISKHLLFRVLCAAAFLQSLLVVLFGGGNDTFSRHLLIVLPASYIAFAIVVNALLSKAGETWGPILKENLPTASFCFALILLFYGLSSGPFKREIADAGLRQEARARLGQWLKTIGKPSNTILSDSVGAIAYYSGFRAIDTFEILENNEKVTPGNPLNPSHTKRRSTKPKRILKGNPNIVPWNAFQKQPKEWLSHGFFLYTGLPSKLLRFSSILGPGIWVKPHLSPNPVKDAQIFDFEEASLDGWTINTDSESMNRSPVFQKPKHQNDVRFYHNKGFLSTFDPVLGDRAKAGFISPKFRIVGDVLCMLIAGGKSSEKLRVEAKVGDSVIFSTTGARTEYFGLQCFDVAKWKGQKARIKVVDRSRGRWGHIMLDYVVQYARP